MRQAFRHFRYLTSPFGTSASGFAAEVAAEEAVAMLDYIEDLYRDWNDGAADTVVSSDSAGCAGSS